MILRPQLVNAWRDPLAQRRVWHIALPLILSNISVPLVGLVDTAVIGHMDGAHHLGAVAVGSTLFTFVLWATGFLRMGTTGFAAQACGSACFGRTATPFRSVRVCNIICGLPRCVM